MPKRHPGNYTGFLAVPLVLTLSVHWSSLVAQLVKNLSAMRETWVLSLGREDALEESTATHSSILTWRILMHRGAWWATVHWIPKIQTRLRD